MPVPLLPPTRVPTLPQHLQQQSSEASGPGMDRPQRRAAGKLAGDSVQQGGGSPPGTSSPVSQQPPSTRAAQRAADIAADDADDKTAAQLLLGMGSVSDSDAEASGDSSSSDLHAGGAGSSKPAGGRGAAAADTQGLRRSSRQARTPAFRASELLGSGSDDEFEPGTKRSGRAAKTPHMLAPQKSELTALCERFQQQFGHLKVDGTPNMLMLNDVAEALGVPRRRLYDVINVFESIEVMKRVGKLMYEWVGFDHMPQLLLQLAEDEENGVPVEDRIRRAPTLIIVNDQGEEIGSGKANSHSLWVLSRRLVRMLLQSDGPIALTSAAALLVGPGGVPDPTQHRSQTQITVERRLYDIGSILCSIGLIERIYVKKRQPAFEWVYGWKPGDAHPPPKLANRYAPPPDASAAAKGAAAKGKPGRKRAADKPTPGELAAGKRSRSEESAALAAMAAMPMHGMPFGMPMAGFGHAMMPAMMPGAHFAHQMSGIVPGTMTDGKEGMPAGMPMAGFFPPPGAFFANPAAMMGGMPGMMPPGAAMPMAEGLGAGRAGGSRPERNSPGSEGEGASKPGVGPPTGAYGPMVMWPPHMMANPAAFQQYQQQMQQQMAAAAAANAKGAPGGFPPFGWMPAPVMVPVAAGAPTSSQQ